MVVSVIALLDPVLDILDRETQIVLDEPEAPAGEDMIMCHVAFADVRFSYPGEIK